MTTIYTDYTTSNVTSSVANDINVVIAGSLPRVVKKTPEQLKWTRPPMIAGCLIDGLDLTRHAADFYTRHYMVLQNYDQARPAFEFHSKMLAWQLSMYLIKACTAEVRHARSQAGIRKSRIKKGQRTFLDAVSLVANTAGYGPRTSVFRQTSWEGLTPRKVALYLVLLFGRRGWAPEFGGRKWKTCAVVLLEYLRGRMSNAMFIDQALGLKHNGNIVYDKISWKSSGLEEILDLVRKAENVFEIDAIQQYGSSDLRLEWTTFLKWSKKQREVGKV